MRRTTPFVALAAAAALALGACSGNSGTTTPTTTSSNGLPVPHPLYVQSVTGACGGRDGGGAATLELDYDQLTGAPLGAKFTAGELTPGKVKVEITAGDGTVNPEDTQHVDVGETVTFTIFGTSPETRVKFVHDADRGDLRDVLENTNCKPDENAMAALATRRDTAAEAAARKPVFEGCNGSTSKDKKFKVTASVGAKAQADPPAILVSVSVKQSTRGLTAVKFAPSGLAGAKVTLTSGPKSGAKSGTWQYEITGPKLTETLEGRVTYTQAGGKPAAGCSVTTPVAWPG